MPAPHDVIPGLYRAFNEREIDAVLDVMHPDVDWPNAWEGGRVHGREAVRAYWTRQFEEISGQVEPEKAAAFGLLMRRQPGKLARFAFFPEDPSTN